MIEMKKFKYFYSKNRINIRFVGFRFTALSKALEQSDFKSKQLFLIAKYDLRYLGSFLISLKLSKVVRLLVKFIIDISALILFSKKCYQFN